MLILQDRLRVLIVRFFAIFCLTCAVGLACALWLETRPIYEIDQIRTPAYVVAGQRMVFTEIGEQRAGCMPRIARGFSYPDVDPTPPHGQRESWRPLVDAAVPNSVLLDQARSQWHPVGWHPSAVDRVSRTDGPQTQTLNGPSRPTSTSISILVPEDSPVGPVRFGEEYDESRCGILGSLLGSTPRIAWGPPMTILPPGSKLPTD